MRRTLWVAAACYVVAILPLLIPASLVRSGLAPLQAIWPAQASEFATACLGQSGGGLVLHHLIASVLAIAAVIFMGRKAVEGRLGQRTPSGEPRPLDSTPSWLPTVLLLVCAGTAFYFAIPLFSDLGLPVSECRPGAGVINEVVVTLGVVFLFLATRGVIFALSRR